MTWTVDLPYRDDVVYRVAASLDHVAHFHELVDTAKWWIYEQISPVLRDGRGLTTGRIFGNEGRLAISVSQQSLLRLNRPVPV